MVGILYFVHITNPLRDSDVELDTKYFGLIVEPWCVFAGNGQLSSADKSPVGGNKRYGCVRTCVYFEVLDKMERTYTATKADMYQRATKTVFTVWLRQRPMKRSVSSGKAVHLKSHQAAMHAWRFEVNIPCISDFCFFGALALLLILLRSCLKF